MNKTITGLGRWNKRLPQKGKITFFDRVGILGQ